jgi:hypothetical protein
MTVAWLLTSAIPRTRRKVKRWETPTKSMPSLCDDVAAHAPHESSCCPDPHETSAQDLDYFVWLIRGGGRDILVDTGFNCGEARCETAS